MWELPLTIILWFIVVYFSFISLIIVLAILAKIIDNI